MTGALIWAGVWLLCGVVALIVFAAALSYAASGEIPPEEDEEQASLGNGSGTTEGTP